MRSVGTATEVVDVAGIADGLLEGLQLVDGAWRYRYLNPAACRHARLPAEALLGRTMMECYPGIEHSELFAALARCMADRAPATFENHFAYPDGEAAWFELRIAPHGDGLRILSIDVSERKRLERAAREGYQQIGRAHV